MEREKGQASLVDPVPEAFRTPTTTASSCRGFTVSGQCDQSDAGHFSRCSQCSWSSPEAKLTWMAFPKINASRCGEAAAKPDLAAAAYELVPERLEHCPYSLVLQTFRRGANLRRMKLFKELVHAVAAPQPQAPAPASEARESNGPIYTLYFHGRTVRFSLVV